MIYRVIPLPNNNMQMRLARLLRGLDPLLENLLRFLYILPMEIDGIGGNFAVRVILAEYELGGLFVVCVGLRGMFLAFLAEAMGACAVA